MPQLAMLVCLVATSLYGCAIQPVNSTAQPSVYGGADANPPADAVAVGDGTLDAAEVNTLLNLAFPQSYDAIKDGLGFPAYRDAVADYYTLPDGRWIRVAYDSDNTAIGFRFGTRE